MSVQNAGGRQSSSQIRRAVSIAASHAVFAIGSMLGRTLTMEAPRWTSGTGADMRALLAESQERIVAVVAEVNGVCPGHAGILLAEGTAEGLARAVIGEMDEPEIKQSEEAALVEIGNIAISAAMTAISMLMGGTQIPGVPTAFRGPAELVLPRVIPTAADTLEVHVSESSFGDRSGSLHLRFVWIVRS